MFKRKKQKSVRDGAKTFSGYINTLELVYNSGNSSLYSRPCVINKNFDNITECDLFINLISNNLVENKTFDTYINGININQINSLFLKNQIVVVKEINDEPNIQIASSIILEKLNDLNLTVGEQIKLSEAYKQNPSVLVFDNFKTNLSEKEYNKLYTSLLDLFCDAILIFVSSK